MNNRDKTKHELLEELQKLQKTEKELQLHSEIMRNITEGINLIRLDDEVIVFTNPKFDEIFGYEHGEMIGKHVSILNAPASKSPEETKQEIVDTVIRTGEWHGEILNIKKNGDHFWCYVNISMFVHPDYGKVFLSVHSDINKRKQAEEALHLEKENFRHSLDDSPLGIRIVSADGDTIYANQAILNFYGYDSLEELQKTPLKNRYTPESYAESQKRKMQRKNGDLSNTRYEISIVRKDGEIRHLRVFRKEVLWDGNPQFQIIYDDITERKQTEEALRESEARFRSLFENSLIGIMSANHDGTLLQVNPALARIYGYKNPETMLSEVTDVAMLYSNPAERKEVLRILHKNGRMEAKEVEMVRRDGSRFFVLMSASEVKDDDGKLLYNQATHIDLTERRKMESELRNSKELLEKLNQHLNEVREDERAAISREIHDELGQSMTALKLDLNQLHKYVINNHEAEMKLVSMINLISGTIKNVQRISSDLRPGILDDLGLVSAIEWYCDEFKTRTGIKCNLKLDNSDFNNSEINLTFFRALQETLTNVIRHANASSVNVKLKQTHEGITLSIQDNGIGMPREKIESHKSLGLISIRERLRQFNGKIDISSKKGDGTKLTFFIPF